jgi:transglutaminase-like putative cysteine protease
MLLQIKHTTLYSYARSVPLGLHRLMLRPVEGHDVQIRSSTLNIQPAHRLRWIHDVFGNSIALVDFTTPADQMNIVSRVVVEQYNTNPFDFVLEPSAIELPFQYDDAEAPDVAPYTQPEFPQDQAVVENFLRPFLSLEGRARTLDFLISLNKSFPLFFQYVRREELGVQSPADTLQRRSGSCRDFTLLLMELVRHLGLAARFVSGYLCHSGDAAPESAHHATHAWAEIYLPGAGWKGFDPTCGILAADLHVRVASARRPDQASPVIGTFTGNQSDLLNMTVTVDAQTLPDQTPPTSSEGVNP